MSFLILVQDEKTAILDVQERSTHGEASRYVQELPVGQRARIVNKDEVADVKYWMKQVRQKREMGFIEEYGIIPNGTRSGGDGARGVGRMIYPAFGGMLEGVVETETSLIDPGNANRDNSTLPLTLSSKSLEDRLKKIREDLGI